MESDVTHIEKGFPTCLRPHPQDHVDGPWMDLRSVLVIRGFDRDFGPHLQPTTDAPWLDPRPVLVNRDLGFRGLFCRP
uniref:Uncharacterized protein n=1 Tax=Solanum tuberosum TaxID=4113 RepID=M1DCV5_SOLTU